MKLYEFYDRVLETTGLEVMTIGSLCAAIKNCLADLTSRGYKEFAELKFEDIKKEDIQMQKGYMSIPAPKDIRKTLYLKIAFTVGTIKAERLALTDPRIQATWDGERYVSSVPSHGCIYYIKEDRIIIEWDFDNLGVINSLLFGYYKRLVVPYIPDDIVTTIEEMNDDKYDIHIREEFEDALVFYASYFFYARYIKDTDKIQLYLNNYKYYVEDILHELSYEDNYFEEDAVIKVE